MKIKKVKSNSVAGTRVMKCSCVSAMQDTMHGAGNRVCNLMGKGKSGGDSEYRCTVCSRVHTVAAKKKEVDNEHSSDAKS